MQITKLGHCCLLVEVDGKRLLVDPGICTTEKQKSLDAIDCIIITHEHGDHCHVESVLHLYKSNPETEIVCNTAVAALLEKEGLHCTSVEDGEEREFLGIKIRAFTCQHAEIYEERGQVPTTGYLLADKLFCPGDSWDIPPFSVDTLALPVGGPWCRIADAIKFALEIAPGQAFPVHDGFLTEAGKSITYKHPEAILQTQNIKFISLEEGGVLKI